jgi:hypothetical protein
MFMQMPGNRSGLPFFNASNELRDFPGNCFRVFYRVRLIEVELHLDILTAVFEINLLSERGDRYAPTLLSYDIPIPHCSFGGVSVQSREA